MADSALLRGLVRFAVLWGPSPKFEQVPSAIMAGLPATISEFARQLLDWFREIYPGASPPAPIGAPSNGCLNTRPSSMTSRLSGTISKPIVRPREFAGLLLHPCRPPLAAALAAVVGCRKFMRSKGKEEN
jgi:hypothetical protein